MERSKAKKLTPTKSLDELVEFFETQDMGELWEQLPAAHFDVEIKSRTHLVAIDEELAYQLAEIAKSQRISSESLINTWLREKVSKQKNAH
ncbi:MAG TPA: CopG family antitoxin [Pyrinomonadaceae bacterium]